MKLATVEKKTFLAGLQCTLTSSCAKKKQNRSKWDQTTTRQIGSDNKNRRTKERERVEIFLGSDPIPIEVDRKPSSANRYPQKITFKKNKWT